MIAASSAAAETPFTTGFNDAFLGLLPDRDAWIARMPTTGAREIRLNAGWALIAPVRPPDAAAATDPAWPGYRFGGLDDSVRRAVAAGLRPMVTGFNAPGWAEEPGRPASARPGTWRPDAVAFGRFMRAVASRYDGTFPDPAKPGARLPSVTAFQVWNEPNIATYLAPQWRGRRPASPAHYRALLNAGYDSVKAVQPRAVVVGAGASPFGDPEPTWRMQPARFWREALCLDRRLRRTCTARTRMDVMSHHPYPTAGPPSQRTRSRDDVSIADIAKLNRITAAARRQGTVGPTAPALWVTEFGVRSSPPRSNGGTALGLDAHGRYLAESLWRLWRQRVRRVYFFAIVDLPSSGSSTILSGLGVFRQDGTPKPAARAVAFTTYAYRSGAAGLRVWVRPATAGAMRVQVQRGSAWRTVATVTARAAVPVTVSTRRAGVMAVRALRGPQPSYVWRVRG